MSSHIIQDTLENLGIMLHDVMRGRPSALESERRRKGPGPTGHFILGSLREYQKDSLGFMTSVWNRYGDVVRVELGPVKAYMLFHPDHAKHVLVDNNRNYGRSSASGVLKELLGEGLLTSEGEHWRRQRRIAQPAFHMKAIASMAGTMTEVTRKALSEWPSRRGESTPVDIAEKCQDLALRIAGMTLFNVDLSDASGTFGQAAKTSLEHMTGRLMQFPRMPLAVPTAANRRFLAARGTIDTLIYKLVADRRKGQIPERPDLLQMLLDARDAESGEGMSDQQLRDELLTLLGAGHETTGLALMWTLYFLSRYPSVREELEREVTEVLSGRAPTLADLPKMPFTKMVISESMRLRSPLWAVGRRAVAEDSVGGVTIPKDATVILCSHLTHRHPDFWPDPEVFDPRRFAEDKVKEMHPFAFFPFGGGPRKCIGTSFAMMELALVLPMILQAFDFSLVPGHEPEISPSLTLRTRNGCWMTLRER